jgi:type IV pilus assembly protein PilY1
MGLTSQDKVKLDSMAVHGGTAINGHAYYADDPAALTAALDRITSDIISKAYSFSISSVSASRISDENFLYEASFMPTNTDPFWQGFLKKYNINTDGTLGSVVWDAGAILQLTDAGSRNIMTYKAGSLISFTPPNITASDLGVSTNNQRDAVVGYIRGEPSYNSESWKLGDIFHSTPITVGTPAIYYVDMRDLNSAFGVHRNNHVRTSANGYRLIVVGANDGQMHAFATGTGAEVWSFIPPNLLPNLQRLAHTSNPSTLPHQYYVDGPVTVADVWLGAGDGKRKSSSDWKTIMIFGEGMGGGSNLWSSSSSCDSNFNSTYTSTYTNYCGYYSFNLENSLSPAFKWLLSPSAGQAPYLGEPWSRMMIHRVRYNGAGQEHEKWVGFIGAGYNEADCHGGGQCDTRGKGFYVVDLSNGQILWSYTLADDPEMKYSIPAAPAIVDTDYDGFIDTVYIGDLGGNVWRFKFCTASDMPSCGISSWSGRRLFNSSGGTTQPIYTSPAVSRDQAKNIWVYWGTGDKMNPNTSAGLQKFFALKDNDRTTTYHISDLVNVTSLGHTKDFMISLDAGYYINLSGDGEKILADPTVFGGVAYFTTYTPSNGGDACAQGGSASLYAINFITGGGGLSDGSRSMSIGTGIPSAPILSNKPGGSIIPDLYVTLSGGGGAGASTGRVNFNPPTLSNKTNILYWRDRRVQ